ncbi:YiiD C-terminal domain-containing protein [Chitiniphilus eburneus]|uniref:Uncharacterized protein n=1 Tax=Chitiniphilus eburneus TaxID=2571148 RepID=A0A4U0PXP3_9NEIS|nr:YiiD C-terminal domain-containing protein [Chitiniphilus eburneus]TJZ73361.1 hypothetical protein FAZ21_10905 [Chitiniphilus eburneus]
MSPATPEFAPHWQARLRGGFPLLDAMQVAVVGNAARWALHAPFAPNRNDHGTAFGGAISMLGRVVTCFAAAFGAVRDAAPGAGRAAVWIPQAACDTARRPKCAEPAGLGRKNTIHCVALLANNRLLAASRA